LQPVPTRSITTEITDWQVTFTASAPRSAFRTNFASPETIPSIVVWDVAPSVRERDIVHRPKKLNATAFPRLLVFDRQFIRCIDAFRTLKASILTYAFQEIEQNKLAQATTRGAVRHT
jgi:hypothetical protein